ncbi:MAG: HAD family phosphatase [bacterium]|nr:HAD family phosphatase [bacterium]MBK8128434.1 HAD family phosphatase [bacterium]
MIKAVFFDFDGTLIDSMPAHVIAWEQILGEVGIRLDDLYFQLHEGEKAEDTVARLLAEHNVHYSHAQQAELIERKRALYRSNASAGLIPEAAELVRELNHRGIACDIVTGSIRSNMDAVLSAEEFALFRSIFTPAEYGRGKPAPDPYLKALEQSGLAAHECLALENAPLGVQSAKAAGLRTVAVTTTLPPSYLSEADHVIHRFADFLHLLEP